MDHPKVEDFSRFKSQGTPLFHFSGDPAGVSEGVSCFRAPPGKPKGNPSELKCNRLAVGATGLRRLPVGNHGRGPVFEILRLAFLFVPGYF